MKTEVEKLFKNTRINYKSLFPKLFFYPPKVGQRFTYGNSRTVYIRISDESGIAEIGFQGKTAVYCINEYKRIRWGNDINMCAPLD